MNQDKLERIVDRASRYVVIFATVFLIYMVVMIVANILATPAHAADQRTWPGTVVSGGRPSTVTLGAPTARGAVATLTFVNEPVHYRNEHFRLDWQGIEVDVYFDQAPGDDTLTAIPPAGYMTIPPEIVVPEETTAKMQIVKYEGM